MRFEKRSLMILLVSAAIFAGISSSARGGEEAEAVNRCGGSAVDTSKVQTAPDFTLADTGGKKRNLIDLTENRPVLVNFWATWCTVCVREIPLLNKLHAKYGKKKMNFIAVNYKDSEKKLQSFLKKNPFDFPVLLDSDGAVTEGLYGLFGLPSTIVVDRSGSIVYSSAEPPTEEQLDELLRGARALEEENPVDKSAKYGLKTGVKAPGFSAKTHDDKTFDLKSSLKKGPVVLVFYRGGWCPFCSTQLRELRDNMKNFKKRGATVAALSVDSVKNARSTYEKEKPGFTLLSDPDAEVLGKYRLSLKLDEKTLKQYSSYGIDIEKASGKKHHQIAVPAVFVISPDGIIRWAFVNEDYKVRAKIKDILTALDAI